MANTRTEGLDPCHLCGAALCSSKNSELKALSGGVLMHAVQCAGAVEEERARRLAAARAHAEELDSLAERPPSTWPASVHTLVKQREAAAAEVRSPLVKPISWKLRVYPTY